MSFLSMMGNSFGCSGRGERLVSAARDGDVQEAKAILEYNPRLAKYSTFGLRNSPLHCSASQGHHEIVFLLLESGVNINLRNTRGQTALMQACQYGHWEVVQTLMLFKANIHRTDYLNGGTAIHFAAINGHSRCIRLILAEYVPSIPDFLNIMRKKSKPKVPKVEFDERALFRVVNRQADGGITALHMAALNGHAETVELLLDLGACVSEVTIDDGSTIDLIGTGSSPLHYAACGGNAQCCQILISRGASLTAKNAKGYVSLIQKVPHNHLTTIGVVLKQIQHTPALEALLDHDVWTPLMVAVSWHRHGLEGILSRQVDGRALIHPSPYLSLPLMSIMKIARKYGWREADLSPAHDDPCVVCLERKCTVAAEGCGHEFCTRCALYLCSTSASSTSAGPPGAIACPLCRHAVVSFFKLPGASPIREFPRGSLSLSICATGKGPGSKPLSSSSGKTSLCRPELDCAHVPSSRSSSFRFMSCQSFTSMKLTPSICMGTPNTRSSIVGYSRSNLQRSVSQGDGRRSWIFALTSS